MTTAIGEKRYTVTDLEALEDPEAYELLDGDLVERNMGYESDVVGLELGSLLRNFTRAGNLGRVSQAGTGLAVYGRPDRIPRSDGAYVSRRKRPSAPEKGYLHVVPDIVWEVVSPHENANRLNQKVSMYLEAGIPLVWVIYPEAREISIHRPSGGSRLSMGDTLTGEDVLPGFSLPLAELFSVLDPFSDDENE